MMASAGMPSEDKNSSSRKKKKEEPSGFSKLQAAISGQSSRELVVKATWTSMGILVLWFVVVHTFVVGDWFAK